MRELPADFKEKVENFIRIGARLVNEFKVPSCLVYGLDETNAQFVSSANRTRELKGTLKVRLLNKGKEKPQITVTFVVKEDGTVLGQHQLIFRGKTNACHPTIPQENSVFMHSDSHWQNDETYIEFLKRVILPKKNFQRIKRYEYLKYIFF